MKKNLSTFILALSLVASSAYAEKIEDKHDLREAHKHLREVIHELERARAANHYDMAGHGAKAEELAKQAEHELHEAVEAAEHEHKKEK